MLDVCTEAEKEEAAEDDDDMDGFQTDDEDDGEGSDKDMGVDVEDGDEADSSRLQKLAAQVCGFPCICICWKPPAFYFSFKLLCSQICWHHM